MNRCRKRAAVEEELPLRQIFDEDSRTVDASGNVAFSAVESSMSNVGVRLCQVYLPCQATPTQPQQSRAVDLCRWEMRRSI